MKRWTLLLLAIAVLALVPVLQTARSQPPTTDERIAQLEVQVAELQSQVGTLQTRVGSLEASGPAPASPTPASSERQPIVLLDNFQVNGEMVLAQLLPERLGTPIRGLLEVCARHVSGFGQLGASFNGNPPAGVSLNSTRLCARVQVVDATTVFLTPTLGSTFLVTITLLP